VLAYTVALSVGRLTLYSAFAKNGEAGDIRLIIAPGTLIASTLILGAVGLGERHGSSLPCLALGPDRGFATRIKVAWEKAQRRGKKSYSWP